MASTSVVFKVDRYNGSRDYERLFNLARETSVICVLDHRDSRTRDVGHTLFSPRSGLIEVSARGICYIWAETFSDFKQQCEDCNLEWIPPAGEEG